TKIPGPVLPRKERPMVRSTQARSVPARRHAYRPRFESLEGRQLLAAGALDTAFNPPNGYALTGFAAKGTKGTAGDGNSVKIQSDGKIVVAGGAFYDFALARYNLDGTPDS